MNPQSGINWQAVAAEATGYLRDLIRIDTTNPPGNETAAARYLADVLAGADISAQVVGPTPDRCSLVARLPGHGLPSHGTDRQRPLLLLSHLDVVPAEPGEWTHPPFAGMLDQDGVIWGRGTVDCKGLVVQELVVLLLLQRAGIPLNRDVVFAATADEEAGGLYGLAWLLAEYPHLLDAGYCINEGGGEGIRLNGRTFYLCQTGEKGISPLRLTAHGRPGHAAVPHDNNAVVHLAHALDRLANAELPLRLTNTVAAFLAALGDDYPLLEQQMGDVLHAIQHNTLSPTMLQAGSKVNVIPSTAEAQVDCRIIPGQTQDEVLAQMRAIIGDLPVDVETTIFTPGYEGAYDGDLYRLIETVLPEHDPQGVVVPFLMTGGTDGRHLGPRGVSVYGFMPAQPEPGLSLFDLAHAHDERITVDNLIFGTRVLYDIVQRFCAAT
ncbi:MAG: M20/M25/M40 family metallo-hydrolase [Chloroflexi bacterium]|nr:M20/M25/M40 family metallo-hydrolase [Chloroflexota bacterium]